MVCGLSSGVVSCIFMNPIDVIRTRFYNQPYINGKGALYTSGVNAFQKISQTEGLPAFYKGFVSHFLRIGPHFALSFFFLGILRRTLSGTGAPIPVIQASSKDHEQGSRDVREMHLHK